MGSNIAQKMNLLCTRLFAVSFGKENVVNLALLRFHYIDIHEYFLGRLYSVVPVPLPVCREVLYFLLVN